MFVSVQKLNCNTLIVIVLPQHVVSLEQTTWLQKVVLFAIISVTSLPIYKLNLCSNFMLHKLKLNHAVEKGLQITSD